MRRMREMTGKRFLSLLLCFVMVLQMVAPGVSLAADALAKESVDLVIKVDKNTVTNHTVVDPTNTVFNTMEVAYNMIKEKDEPSLDESVTPTYIFDDWYQDEACTQPWVFYGSGGTNINDKKVIYANWLSAVKVTFDANGGTVTPESSIIEKGTAVDEPMITANPLGKGFVQWNSEDGYGNATKWVFTTSVDSDIELVAEWKSYKATFDIGIGEDVMTAKDDGTVDFPPDPDDNIVPPNSEFLYWVDGDGNEFKAGTVLTADITLTPKYKPYPTVTFDLGGGTYAGKTTIDPIQLDAASGTIAAKDAPDEEKLENSGYTFLGWYDEDGEKWNFNDYVTESMTLTAVWEELYTVTFNTNGGSYDVEGEATTTSFKVEDIESESTIASTDVYTVTKEGYTFGGWYYEDEDGKEVKFEFSDESGTPTEVEDHMDLKVRWLYEVEFKVAVSTATEPTGVTAPIERVVTTDTVFYEEITFAEAFAALSTEDKALLVFGSDYYQLDGWYADSNYNTLVKDSDKVSMTAVPKTYYAQWERLYAVTYNLDGGEYVKDGVTYNAVNPYIEYVSYGKTAPEPVKTNLSKSGYTFTGWTFYSNTYEFSTEIKEERVINATWESAVTVTVVPYLSATALPAIDVTVKDTGTIADLQAAIDERIADSYGSQTVETWYTDSGRNTKVDFTDKTLADFDGETFYGNLEQSSDTWTVTFDTDGGTPAVVSQIVAYNGKAKEPTGDLEPTKEGYVFAGWYDESGFIWDFANEPVIRNTVLKAKWLTAVVVTYDADNGTTNTTIDMVQGDKLTKPATDPEKDGYIFEYWADEDDKEWNFTTGTVGSANMTLTAVWTKAHTITKYDGTSEIGTETVKEGDKLAEPDDPTKTDYRFVGWYSDSALTTAVTFPLDVTADTSIYAKFDQIVYVTVTFNAGDGKFKDNTSTTTLKVEENIPFSVPEEPTLASHSFVGWYTTDDVKWDFTTDSTATDLTLYASWSEEFTYKVDFDNNGRAFIEDIAARIYTEESTSFYIEEPDTPTTANYALFLYWTTDAAGENKWNFATDIVTGSMTLYAQWEPIYKVTFIPNGGTMEEYFAYYTEGSLVTEPEITLKGFVLTDWYLRAGSAMADTDEEWDFDEDKVGDSDFYLYAVWEKDPNDPLTSVEVKTSPNQLVYSEYDYFNPLGLILTLNYAISDSEDVMYTADAGFTFSPSLDTRLTLGTTKVTVYYGDESVDIAIEVKESVRYLTGMVVNTSGTVQSEVNVYLQQNGVNVSGYEYRTDETGVYSFAVNDLAPGYYTIYCYQTQNPGYRTRSVLTYVDGFNQQEDPIVMPDGMVSASVNNNSSLTVASVANLDALADELAKGEDPLNSIRVAVNVSEASASNDKAFINAYKTHGETIGQYLDLSLIKYLTYNNASTTVTVPITSLKETLVEITINLPTDLQNKGNYFVYRMHDGAMDKLETKANENLEKIEFTSNTITLYVNKFSTYAIAYTEQVSSGGANTGDSEVDGDRFTVTSRKVVNGEVNVDAGTGGTFYFSNNYPVEGTTVYLYPASNLGYTIDYVVAVNENGIEVRLMDGADNSYYFVQGGSPVTVTVAFRSLPIPVSPEGYEGFYDVNESDWFYNQVLKAAHLGYMVGVDYGVFSPNTGTTRGQIVQILYNLEGKPGASTFSGFPDVYAYDYYAQAVTWAKEVGAVAGYDDGYFRPNQEVTREEMAVIFFRYAELSANVTPIMWPFTVEYGDDFAISTWAKQAVVWCTNKGLFTGKNANMFAPKDIATRAEVATCVLALMDQQVVVVETIF